MKKEYICMTGSLCCIAEIVHCKATILQLKKRRILGVGFVEDTHSQINDILFHFQIDLVT